MDESTSFIELFGAQQPYLLAIAAAFLGLALGAVIGIFLGYRVLMKPVQRRYQNELGVANEEIIRIKTDFSEYKRRVRRKLEREISRIRTQESVVSPDAAPVVSGAPGTVSGQSSDQYREQVAEYFRTTAELFREMQDAQQAMFDQMQRVNHRYTQVIEHVNRGATTLTGGLPQPQTKQSLPKNRAESAAPGDRPAFRDTQQRRRPTQRVRKPNTHDGDRAAIADFMADLQRREGHTVEHDPDANDRSDRYDQDIAEPQRVPSGRRQRRGRLGK